MRNTKSAKKQLKSHLDRSLVSIIKILLLLSSKSELVIKSLISNLNNELNKKGFFPFLLKYFLMRFKDAVFLREWKKIQNKEDFAYGQSIFCYQPIENLILNYYRA
jgi:hypothetical protein